ncbi:MAG: hypothetical protein HGA93_06220 [Methanothrix sp.]|nr:hypothetical protein [Methanothrix sp.]
MRDTSHGSRRLWEGSGELNLGGQYPLSNLMSLQLNRRRLLAGRGLEGRPRAPRPAGRLAAPPKN